MKKIRSFLLLFLGVLLAASPLLVPRVRAAGVVAPTHMLDSILPNETPRVPSGGTATTAPDPADGMPFMGGEEEEEELPHKAEKGGRSGDKDAAKEAAPTPADERISAGVAILVASLAAISVIVAIFYVFRGRRDTHRRD